MLRFWRGLRQFGKPNGLKKFRNILDSDWVLEKFRFLFKGTVGYASFMKHTYSLNKYSKDEVAQFWLKVITFYDCYGVKATKEAFSVGRSTVFLWKKSLSARSWHIKASHKPKKSAAPANSNVWCEDRYNFMTKREIFLLQHDPHTLIILKIFRQSIPEQNTPSPILRGLRRRSASSMTGWGYSPRALRFASGVYLLWVPFYSTRQNWWGVIHNWHLYALIQKWRKEKFFRKRF